MSIREALDAIRAEYQALSTEELVDLVNEMGIETDAVTHDALVDELMSIEEYAAFH